MTKSKENSFRSWHKAMHENVRLRADNARLMEERSRLKETEMFYKTFDDYSEYVISGHMLNRLHRAWDREIGNGINSGVSVQAKPTIIPWSPAPSSSKSFLDEEPPRVSRERVTAWEMSDDCSFTDTVTPQV